MNNAAKKRVLIIGAGWLGTPFALKLALAGFKVLATKQQLTTNLPKHTNLNFTTYVAGVTPPLSLFESFKPQYVAIFLTPIEHLSTIWQQWGGLAYSQKARILVSSSISVYPNDNGYYSENFSCFSNNTLLSDAEQMLQEINNQAVIARLGGLCGAGRWPGKYLSDKPMKDSMQATNLLHQYDAIEALYSLLFNHNIKGVFNIVAPLHPTKLITYNRQCHVLGIPLPKSTNVNNQNVARIVSSKKLIDTIKFKFAFPNPIHFL